MLKFLCFIWLVIVFAACVYGVADSIGWKSFLITAGIVLAIMLTFFSLVVLSDEL